MLRHEVLNGGRDSAGAENEQAAGPRDGERESEVGQYRVPSDEGLHGTHDALLAGAASCLPCGGITVSIGRAAAYLSARDAIPSSCFRCMTKWATRLTSLVSSNGMP